MLVVGALLSAWRLFGQRQLANRMWGTILIAGGGMAMGAVGTLNRFGFSGAQSLGETLAIVLIFAGFKLADRGNRPRITAPARSLVVAGDEAQLEEAVCLDPSTGLGTLLRVTATNLG